MKNILLPAFALCCALNVNAADAPLWMRYPSLSPDGKTIAFSYKGDIYTVPASGGKATQLTTHPKQDTHPIWSPDGQKIAFASDRAGSFDIYIMDKTGGVPTRLTTNSASEIPETFRDATHICTGCAIPLFPVPADL